MTETHVYEESPEVNKRESAPEGYSIFYQHRQSKKEGGIALIHRDDIKIKAMKTDASKFTTCEIMLMKITNIAKGITLAVVYRPPSSSIPNFITEMNDLISGGILGKRFIICGDLNCPGPAKTKGLVNIELQHLIEEHSLHQHVHVPTCRTENILDALLCCAPRSDVAVQY